MLVSGEVWHRHGKGTVTAMTMDASSEKQKPISVQMLLNSAGLCLPSRSIRACMLSSPSTPVTWWPSAMIGIPFVRSVFPDKLYSSKVCRLQDYLSQCVSKALDSMTCGISHWKYQDV